MCTPPNFEAGRGGLPNNRLATRGWNNSLLVFTHRRRWRDVSLAQDAARELAQAKPSHAKAATRCEVDSSISSLAPGHVPAGKSRSEGAVIRTCEVRTMPLCKRV
eukprot:4047828-Prymnesium_polylepis.1